jgi:hypothetical protein
LTSAQNPKRGVLFDKNADKYIIDWLKNASENNGTKSLIQKRFIVGDLFVYDENNKFDKMRMDVSALTLARIDAHDGRKEYNSVQANIQRLKAMMAAKNVNSTQELLKLKESKDATEKKVGQFISYCRMTKTKEKSTLTEEHWGELRRLGVFRVRVFTMVFTLVPEKKVPKKKDPNHPKKPVGVFIMYANANRERVRSEHPDAKFGDIVSSMCAS